MFVAIAVSLLLGAPCAALPLARLVLFELFRIPAGSMHPGLPAGSLAIVASSAYDWRLLGVAVGRRAEPDRGDIAIFRLPSDPEQTYVKRVVGLPGETVEVRDEVVYIDGVAVARTPVGEREYIDHACERRTLDGFEEALGDVPHVVLQEKAYARRIIDYGPRVVPAGQYFVLGDNRDSSSDSRIWGFVPRDDFIGMYLVTLWTHGRSCGD